MSEFIIIPDIGTDEAVEIIEINVSKGDKVEAEQTLMVLESDKASMEIPAPQKSEILEVLVKVGDQVKTGTNAFSIAAVKKNTPLDKKLIESDLKEKNPQTKQQNPINNQPAEVSESIQVHVPDIGTTDEVDLIEISVAVGETVVKEQTLIVLESDKASMEIPSPCEGVVQEIVVAPGQSLTQDDLILTVLKKSTTSQSENKSETKSKEGFSDSTDHREAQASVTLQTTAIQDVGATGIVQNKPSQHVYAGPAVRLMARELGVDLALVQGTGPSQRILKGDIQSYVKSLIENKATNNNHSLVPEIPEVDFSQFGEVKLEKMSKLAKLTAVNMQRSWLNIPHVTQFEELDITDLDSFRKSQAEEATSRNIKLTPLAFIFKALASALKKNPKFNASLHADGESLFYKQYVHIGMAVDTPQGLVVPVIRNIDKKSIWELAQEITEMAEKARNKKLRPNDMKGGCFTVSSLGRIGGTGFTPIVNAPEVGILGVSNMQIKPVWNQEKEVFEPHKILPVSLSYDHRVVNGADAGRFLETLKILISDLRQLALLG